MTRRKGIKIQLQMKVHGMAWYETHAKQMRTTSRIVCRLVVNAYELNLCFQLTSNVRE
jgi:hypothetical protein